MMLFYPFFPLYGPKYRTHFMVQNIEPTCTEWNIPPSTIELSWDTACSGWLQCLILILFCSVFRIIHPALSEWDHLKNISMNIRIFINVIYFNPLLLLVLFDAFPQSRRPFGLDPQIFYCDLGYLPGFLPWQDVLGLFCNTFSSRAGLSVCLFPSVVAHARRDSLMKVPMLFFKETEITGADEQHAAGPWESGIWTKKVCFLILCSWRKQLCYLPFATTLRTGVSES